MSALALYSLPISELSPPLGTIRSTRVYMYRRHIARGAHDELRSVQCQSTSGSAVNKAHRHRPNAAVTAIRQPPSRPPHLIASLQLQNSGSGSSEHFARPGTDDCYIARPVLCSVSAVDRTRTSNRTQAGPEEEACKTSAGHPDQSCGRWKGSILGQSCAKTLNSRRSYLSSLL